MRTFLRREREQRGIALREAARLTGIGAGELSRFERGHQLPSDRQIVAMAAVYGPLASLYPPTVLHALAPDRRCPACNEPLEPDALASRKWHPSCRRPR